MGFENMPRHLGSARGSRRHLLGAAAAAVGLVTFGRRAAAQTQSGARSAWPARPVRILVPFAPGGTTDLLARLVAPELSARLGQQFVVENRSGGGGNIAAEEVARASDGHTLLMGTPGTQVINKLIYKSLGYDSDRDFAPISLVARVPNIVVVPPSSGARSLQELLAQAKARPGELFYASPGAGGTVHLATELLKVMTGTDMVHVPYRGSAPALQDLIAGRVHLMLDNLPASLPHVQSGTLRALAVTSDRRWPGLPNVPTVAEAGVPGYEASSWFCLVGPASTPAQQCEAMAGVIDGFLGVEANRRRFLDLGAEPVGGPPALLANLIASERVKWRRVVEASGATAD